MTFHPDGSIPLLLTLWNSFAKQCLKSLILWSIKILYGDLEQGSAFTRIAWASFLSFNCYVNESVGCAVTYKLLRSKRAPHLNSLCRTWKGRDRLVQAEGAREFRKPSRTPFIVRDVKDHSSPGYYQWQMTGWAVLHHKNCWNWGSLLEWTAIEEEARGLWQSDLSGRKAMCHIAVIIYSKYFSVCDLPLNRNCRRCKFRGITSKHRVLPVGKLHRKVSWVWGNCARKSPADWVASADLERTMDLWKL